MVEVPKPQLRNVEDNKKTLITFNYNEDIHFIRKIFEKLNF